MDDLDMLIAHWVLEFGSRAVPLKEIHACTWYFISGVSVVIEANNETGWFTGKNRCYHITPKGLQRFKDMTP